MNLDLNAIDIDIADIRKECEKYNDKSRKEPPWVFEAAVLFIDHKCDKALDWLEELRDQVNSNMDVFGLYHIPAYNADISHKISTLQGIRVHRDEVERRVNDTCKNWKSEGKSFEKPMSWARAIRDEYDRLRKNLQSASLPFILAARTALQNVRDGDCDCPLQIRELLQIREKRKQQEQ